MSLIAINPCSEKLSGSINFNGDKFCATCNKRIYNFSRMSDEELISFLSKPKENTCGIFDASQVMESTPMDVSHLKRRTTWKSILATLAATMISFTAFSQEKKDSTKIISPNNFTITPSDTKQSEKSIIISGIVTDSVSGKPLDFIQVKIKNNTDSILNVAYTYEDGSFKISIPNADSTKILCLEIYDLRYKTVSIELLKRHLDKDLFVSVQLVKKKSTKPHGGDTANNWAYCSAFNKFRKSRLSYN